MEDFPDELLERIISFLSIGDAKQVSLCSRRFYNVALRRIWSFPRFIISCPETCNMLCRIDFRTCPVRCKEICSGILHLPIRELHSRDFLFWPPSLLHINTLKLLYLDGRCGSIEVNDLHYMKGMDRIIIHTSSLSKRIENYVPVMQNLSCSLITDGPELDFNRLKEIRNIEIEILDIQWIVFRGTEPKEFVKLLLDVRPKRLFVKAFIFVERPSLQFSIHDIEVMDKNDIRVEELSTAFLLEPNNPFLWDVVSKMKYLKSFYIEKGVGFTLKDLEKFNVEAINVWTEQLFCRSMCGDIGWMVELCLEEGCFTCLGDIFTSRSCVELKRNYEI